MRVAREIASSSYFRIKKSHNNRNNFLYVYLPRYLILNFMTLNENAAQARNLTTFMTLVSAVGKWGGIQKQDNFIPLQIIYQNSLLKQL